MQLTIASSHTEQSFALVMICSVVLVVIMKYNSLLLIEAHSPVDDYDHEKVPAHSFKEHQSLLALGFVADGACLLKWRA